MADAQPYLEATIRGELVNALQALYKEQPAKPFTFLAEYFAKLVEPVAAEQKEAAPAAQGKGKKENKKENKKEAKKEAKKAGKKKVDAKMAKSDVVIDCTPGEPDREWDDIKKDIFVLDLNGVMWAQDFVLQDFVYGLKKLSVVCQINDAECPSTSVIVEALLEIPGIGGAEMVSIQTAANDWGNKPKPKAAKGGGGGSKAKKEKGAKKEAEKPALVVTQKEIDVAASKIAIAAAEAEFFVAGVADMDRSAQLNITVAQLEAVRDLVHAKLPALNLMIVAAGSSQVTVFAQVVDARISAAEWVKQTAIGAAGAGDANKASLIHDCDPDNDEFAIKLKDVASANAFAYLKKQGVLDDGSEEVLYGDNTGEGY